MTCCVRAPTLYGRPSVLAVRLLESHLEGEIWLIFKFLHPLLIILLILECTQKASFVRCVDSSGRQAVNLVSDGLQITSAGKMIYKESFSKLQRLFFLYFIPAGNSAQTATGASPLSITKDLARSAKWTLLPFSAKGVLRPYFPTE